ncbi:uncharacterized protein LOC141628131 [Silene latifolia]|uniref:uncharacterized protein LOC141628131 n=1 Tax=Silene latifolia TaxID=37657 RepID=UPI003D76C144
MYHSLIQKIQSRISHWASKNLSYAGRVQLLNSAIFGLESFWCSCLFLPATVIGHIERLCRQFIWGYSQGTRKLIFFSWEKVCRSSRAGGFDIREILSWNKTLMMKQFWKLFCSSRTVWTNWMHAYIIKDADLWTIQPLVSSSFLWKRFLQLRDHLIHKTGMHQAQLLRATGPPRLRLRLTYQALRGAMPNLFWTKALMDPVIMPRYKVIVLLAFQNSLSTTDNLCKRGFHMVSRCILCLKAEETTSHLFFDCEYSSGVLQALFTWQGITRRPLSLKHEIRRQAQITGKNIRKKWAKCTLSAAVYNLWAERNARIFQDTCRSSSQLICVIKNVIRIRVLACMNGLTNEAVSISLAS